MLRSLILYLLCFLPCCIKAQLGKSSKTSSLVNPGVKGMAPGKGLEIYQEYVPGFDLTSPHSQSNHIQQENRSDRVSYSQETGVKLKVPVLLSPRTKLLLEAKYSDQRFQFDDGKVLESVVNQDLSTKNLRSFRLGAIAVRSLNQKNYLVGRFAASFNGSDFNQIYPGIESMNMSLIVLYGIKKNEVTEWGFGVAQALQFGRYQAYPILRYNRTFNDKWGIELTLPKEAYLRHNISQCTITHVGLSLDGNSYNLLTGDAGSPQWMQLQQNMLRLEGEISQKVAPMIWLSFQTGYLQPISWEWTPLDHDTPLVGSQERSWYTRFAVSIRAPQR